MVIFGLSINYLASLAMSTFDDSNSDTNTLSTNILIPVYSDKTAILWDGNDATILGTLYEVGRYYTSTGLFQTLIRDRTVPLSNGRLAIEE